MSVVPFDQHALPAAVERRSGHVTLADELGLWREAAEMAKLVAPTPFVPEALRNNPAAVAACILRANELGISAMQGLAQIHIIKNRPALAAELMRALILGHGHELWTDQFTTTTVTLCGRRLGTDTVQKVTWTMDDAKRANLLGNPSWKAYPRAMLLARATGEIGRLMFADVLAGISYTVEEVEDGFDEAVTALPPGDGDGPAEPKPQTRKASRTSAKKAPARRSSAAQMDPVGPPPLPGEDGFEDLGDGAPVADPDEVVLRRAQQIAMSAGNAGVDHHHVVAAITNGLKTSAKTVTAEEATQVIDALTAIREGRSVLVAGDPPTIGPAPEDGPDGAAVLDWTESDWRQFAIARDINPNSLLLRARAVASSIGEEPPGKLADIVGRDVLAEALHSEILNAG